MKSGYIYSITSKSTGMVYIGSTTKQKLKTRLNYHIGRLINKKHKNWKLSYLFHYRGINDLIFKEELKIEFEDYKELLSIEGKLIRSVCDEFSLNIDKWPELGPGFYGRKHKPESIEKIRLGNLGKTYSQQTIYKMSNIKKGKHPSVETRLKMGNSRRGNKNHNYGKHPSQKTRELMSKNHADFKGDRHPFYNHNHTMESRELISKNHADVSGENNPMYGSVRCSKEYLDITPGGQYYFLINNTKYCKNFNLNSSSMIQVAKGNKKAYKGHKLSYASQWLIDKVKSQLKPDQYWVEIDKEGNIIEGNQND